MVSYNQMIQFFTFFSRYFIILSISCLCDKNKRINPYVQQMGKEPGLYFERRLFGGYTMALIVSTDSEWNENKEITGILNSSIRL